VSALAATALYAQTLQQHEQVKNSSTLNFTLLYYCDKVYQAIQGKHIHRIISSIKVAVHTGWWYVHLQHFAAISE
jgi:hypothetical protein